MRRADCRRFGLLPAVSIADSDSRGRQARHGYLMHGGPAPGEVSGQKSLNGVIAMSLIDFLILLLVAGICGSLGQTISGYSRGGCLVSIALGFIGALLGGALARLLHLPELFMLTFDSTSFPIIWSIIGSALFVAVISLITRRRLD